MGNCLGKRKDARGMSIDVSRFSFSRRLDPWEKTGMVAFRNSSLREFPKQVQGVAKKVRVLDGSNNKIREIPSYIELMTVCNRIGLSKNRITDIPSGISALTSLRVLLLDHNRLRSLPLAIFELAKLERLNVSHNHLTEIPAAVGKLSSLKYLDVSDNKIDVLPREVGQLAALEDLHASNNALTRLPVDLAKLERLRIVVAENNAIDTVPSEVLMYCEGLQTLALHGNPITLEKLQETKGYSEFEGRRKAKWDKTLAAGVLLGASRFEESADRRLSGDQKRSAAGSPLQSPATSQTISTASPPGGGKGGATASSSDKTKSIGMTPLLNGAAGDSSRAT